MAYPDTEDLKLPSTTTSCAQIAWCPVGGRIPDVEITTAKAAESVNGATGRVFRQLFLLGVK